MKPDTDSRPIADLMATDRADTTAAATDRVADASTLLDELADRAQHYVAAASATNTRRAYAADWRHFTTWCRQQNLEPAPSNPRIVGLYITACASGAATADRKPNAVTTIERRLSALSAHYTQLGMPLDRTDRHIATVLAGIRNTHARPRAKRNPC